MWIDGTAVGVPSDYYYLAATGPALDVLTGSEQCRATRRYVIADHLPAFAQGAPDSPGDYVAHGLGTCTVGDQPTRWAYFVAAPGYGPLREVGIPSSGLYVVVAVMPASQMIGPESMSSPRATPSGHSRNMRKSRRSIAKCLR